jgi:hypothetical protein
MPREISESQFEDMASPFVQIMRKWIQSVKYTTYFVYLIDCIHFYVWDCHSLEVEVFCLVKLIDLCGKNRKFYNF